MAVAVERLPLAGGRPAERPHRRALVCGVAAVFTALGLGTALYFGVAPAQVTIHESVNVIDPSGTDGSSLVVSDRTRSATRTASCVPLSTFDDSADQERACGPRARQRLQVAGFGLAAFIAGMALWIVSGGDRYLGVSGRRTYVAGRRHEAVAD
jgi:hypothetical protein